MLKVLEEWFELLLVNAQHLKSVPGRKTDVKGAEWIADLLRHRLLEAELCSRSRSARITRVGALSTSLVQERTAAANRLQKVFGGATVKLASVAGDVLGRS